MEKSRSDYWHFDVLADLAAALRREGLSETAEAVEDAMTTLLQEISRQQHTSTNEYGPSWHARIMIRQ